MLLVCSLLLVSECQAAGDRETADPEIASGEAPVIDWAALIETESAAAEDSRMNIDFVPGMMTVLRGDDLEAGGVRTVHEALALIPGLHLSMNSYGIKKVIVRGLGYTFGTASLKLLLNGISMNDALSGNNSALFDIAIEQVERIEVIRGPGSVAFGENACAGVINVITRKNETKVFGRIGKYDTAQGGMVYAYTDPGKDLHVSINMAGWDTSGADVECAADRLKGTVNDDVSNAPGPTNEAHDNMTAVVEVDYRNVSVSGQYTAISMGDYFGFGMTLSDPDNEKVQDYSNMMIEARYSLDINASLETHYKLGWMQYDQEWEGEIFPAGYIQPSGEVLGEGMTEHLKYREAHFYCGADTVWKGWQDHTWLVGFSLEHISLVDAWSSLNGDYFNLFPDVDSRQHISLFTEDEYELTDRITITAGLRYDIYDDVGNNLTPRVAAVYRLRDRHILKVQYAQAFRPPTFNELYGLGEQFAGSEDIDPETIDTYEFGYIYKGVVTDGSITLFYSKLKNLIAYDYSEELESFQYGNIADAVMHGVEVELEWQVTQWLNLDGNVSYVTTDVSDTGNEIPGTANWLGNLGATFTIADDLLLNAQYRYVGDRHRAENDYRDSLDPYTTVDITASIYNVFRQGLTLRTGITNLFDATIEYPASVAYPEDFIRSGLAWWAQFSFKF